VSLVSFFAPGPKEQLFELRHKGDSYDLVYLNPKAKSSEL